MDALTFPQVNLTVACTLTGRALVICDGDWALAVRGRAKPVTHRGPEVERGGMRYNLAEGLSLVLGGEKKHFTRLSQIATSFTSHL